MTQLPNRQETVGNRIFAALENAARNNQFFEKIGLHLERNNGEVYEILVKYEVSPTVSSNRSFYPQDQHLIIRVVVNLREDPAITLHRTSTILGTAEGEDQFQYFGVNEPELKVLIDAVQMDTANWCPLGLRELCQK